MGTNRMDQGISSIAIVINILGPCLSARFIEPRSHFAGNTNGSPEHSVFHSARRRDSRGVGFRRASAEGGWRVGVISGLWRYRGFWDQVCPSVHGLVRLRGCKPIILVQPASLFIRHPSAPTLSLRPPCPADGSVACLTRGIRLLEVFGETRNRWLSIR